jgi:tetratricopeptide (TPR) repeat protein
VPLVAGTALTLAAIERDRDRPGAAGAHLAEGLQMLTAAAGPARPGPAAGPARSDPAAGPVAAERDVLLAWTLIGLGDWHRGAARHRPAAAAYGRALALARAPDAGPVLRSAVYTALGVLAKERGELDRAQAWYARVRAVHDAAGATDVDEAALRHNLAGLAHARGDHDTAERLARQAVGLRRQGTANPVAVAVDLAVLGSALAGQGRLDAARQVFAEALDAYRAARPPRRLEIACVQHCLADVEHTAGRFTQAQRHYRAALAGKRALLGDDHPDVRLIARHLSGLRHDHHPPCAHDHQIRSVDHGRVAADRPSGPGGPTAPSG